LQATALFAQMAKGLTPDLVEKTKAIFQWTITKDGKPAGTWTVDLKNGSGSVYEGAAKEKAGCTLTLSDDDFVALVEGKLDSMKAFMSGKLKVGGNVMLAQKLKGVLGNATLKAQPAAGSDLQVGGLCVSCHLKPW
jgi:(3R)-3-hydroxyacyl-CoA dehydrogenase / 3a,7a,12a-trihydroxy-5b-cholest-24-enoyl-CoA hydratase / enoyl-CoA hydratase 2